MFKRNESYYQQEGLSSYGTVPETRQTKFMFIYCLVCILVLVTAGLLVFFLYPREPTVTQNGVTVQSFNVTPTSMVLNGAVNVLVDNPNYVDIVLNSIDLTVTHDTTDVGSIKDTDKVATKRETSSLSVAVSLRSSDAAACLSMYNELQSNGYVTFRVHGPVVVQYLSFDITQSIDITQQFSPK